MLTKFFAGVVLCASLAACSNEAITVPGPPPASPTPAATATPVSTATPVATASPTPVATAVPTPGAVTLSPSALTFLAVGAGSAQPVTVSEAGYSGSFTTSTTTCATVASIAPAQGSSFTVTPLGVGSCSFTITGAGINATTLSVGVTKTSIGGS